MTFVWITRPRHPLQGRSLRVLGQMRRHGRVELLLVLPDGSKSLIPAAWTDADSPAADSEQDAATLGSVADLLHACAVISALLARGAQEQAAQQSPCKEDNRAAYPAQSAAGPGSGATPDPAREVPRTAGRGGDHDAGPPDRRGRHGSRRAAPTQGRRR